MPSNRSAARLKASSAQIPAVCVVAEALDAVATVTSANAETAEPESNTHREDEVAGEDEYAEDFHGPIAAPVEEDGKSAQEQPGGAKANDAQEAAGEDEYAEDFDGPAAAPDGIPSGNSQEQQSHAAPPAVAEDVVDDIYDADFAENTGTLPPATAEEMPQDSASALPDSTGVPGDEADSYQEDFEHAPPSAAADATGVPEPSATPPAAAAQVTTSAESRPESLKIRTDLIGSHKTSAVPAAHSAKAAADSSATISTERPALSKQNTATTGIPDEGTGRGDSARHSTAVPSTVRSEYETPVLPPQSSAEPAPHGIASYASSFKEDDIAADGDIAGDADLGNNNVDNERATATAVGTEYHSAGDQAEQNVTEGEQASAVADEPIDEIMYVESQATSQDKDGDVQSNNYVHSPARQCDHSRAVRSDSVAEEEHVEGEAGESPTRQGLGDQPDEEIREEIE
jgi:hypothetical protein